MSTFAFRLPGQRRSGSNTHSQAAIAASFAATRPSDSAATVNPRSRSRSTASRRSYSSMASRARSASRPADVPAVTSTPVVAARDVSMDYALGLSRGHQASGPRRNLGRYKGVDER